MIENPAAVGLHLQSEGAAGVAVSGGVHGCLKDSQSMSHSKCQSKQGGNTMQSGVIT